MDWAKPHIGSGLVPYNYDITHLLTQTSPAVAVRGKVNWKFRTDKLLLQCGGKVNWKFRADKLHESALTSVNLEVEAVLIFVSMELHLAVGSWFFKVRTCCRSHAWVGSLKYGFCAVLDFFVLIILVMHMYPVPMFKLMTMNCDLVYCWSAHYATYCSVLRWHRKSMQW
jgi:hypothetical protein